MDPMSTVCGVCPRYCYTDKVSEILAEVRENSFPLTRAVERKKCMTCILYHLIY